MTCDCRSLICAAAAAAAAAQAEGSGCNCATRPALQLHPSQRYPLICRVRLHSTIWVDPHKRWLTIVARTWVKCYKNRVEEQEDLQQLAAFAQALGLQRLRDGCDVTLLQAER